MASPIMKKIKMEADTTMTKTLIVVILDESGSMNVQKSAVVRGYQTFINEQKKITEDKARLLLIKFNHSVSLLHSVMALEKAPVLTASNYFPNGTTALYDAVAEGIRMAEACAEVNERILVLIMTDGQENSSIKTSLDEVRKLMQEKERLGNWTFSYIGQKPEVWAKTMRQSIGNVRPYNLQEQQSNMKRNSSAVATFRRSGERSTITFYGPSIQPK